MKDVGEGDKDGDGVIRGVDEGDGVISDGAALAEKKEAAASGVSAFSCSIVAVGIVIFSSAQPQNKISNMITAISFFI